MGLTGREPPGAVRVLYLAGTGRSGSTVLANVLGEAAGCVSAGELRYLWQRGVVEDRPCGCGERFSGCPFWQDVCADAGLTAPGARVVAARLASLLRLRALPDLLRARRRPDGGAALLGTLAGDVAAAYRAVRDRSGADVVVDSSKLPSYAALLTMVPGVDVTTVHLVRDPRAAAFSWTRRKERDGRGSALMERRGVAKSTVLWTTWNAALEGFSGGGRYLRVRYEDFVAAPERTVRRVLDLAGVCAQPPVDAAGDGVPRVRLGIHHTVAGNPSRHTTGVVPLRLDDEWRSAMSRADRLLVTGGAAALMRRYGYPLRSPDTGGNG